MPDQLSALAFYAIGLLAVQGVWWLIRRVAQWESRWFLEIVQASDAQLAARPIPKLKRDCKRMGDNLTRMYKLAEINPSLSTDDLVAEQYARLVNALDVAVRIVRTDIEPVKPEWYAHDSRS